MRRHWRNKAASTAVAIMIAASMFSGSLTTAWAEGEVADTTSEETPTYEASNDSATEEKAAADNETDGEESEESDQGATEEGAEESSDAGKTDGETADGAEIDGKTADGEAAGSETADGDATDVEAAEGESAEEAETEAEGETFAEETDLTEDAAADVVVRTPDITDGTSYSENTTISGKTIQGVVIVEDDTTVIFENCTFIGSEDDGTGEMGVTVEGDGVAILNNATFITREVLIDDDSIETLGEEYELSISNVFDGGKVGEYSTTTVTYPCETYTVGTPDYEEILSVDAGDLLIVEDATTEVEYMISYTPDKSGYNTTHITSIEFDDTTIKFPTVLNVESGGPVVPEDPEGPTTDSGDGITPKRTITIEKKWKNAEKYYDHSKLRVFVKILDSNGKEIGEVELNKDNRWTATYPAADSDQTLDMDAEYSVEEYKILNGDGEDVTNGYVLIDKQEKNRYSYSRTDEIKVGGTYILGYTLDGNASYELMSSDGSKIVTTNVPARTWTDIEPSETFYWNTLAPSQKDYHNNDSFWNFQHKSTGGYVHGSESSFIMSSESTPIKYYARQFRYNYGKIVSEYSMYSHDASGNCTKIAMDGAQIYPIVYSKDTLFTLTNQECFYVYHSSDCVTERYMLRDDLTNKNAGTFDIVSLVRSKHFYGGYYKSYADEGTPYTGASSKWNKSEAYTTSGFRLIPVPGTTYYLKEVPNEYLRPRYHALRWISGSKKITQIYLANIIDDNNYLSLGFEGKDVDGNALASKDLRGYNNPLDTVYYKVKINNRTYTYKAYTSAIPAGLMGFYNLYYNLEPDLKDGMTFEYTPYLVTPDNIKVWQQTKTYKIISNATNIGTAIESDVISHFIENYLSDLNNSMASSNGTYNSDGKLPTSSNPTSNVQSTSSNSQGSSGGSSGSSGSSGNSSGGSSYSSGTSDNNAVANNTEASNTGDTDTEEVRKIDQNPPKSNDNGESSDKSNPDSSLDQEKQSGAGQQNGDTWKEEKGKSNWNWWIWAAGAGLCGGLWFIIWKRRKEEDQEDIIG